MRGTLLGARVRILTPLAMILDKSSPSRNIPVELNPRQSSYLDGVKYSIEMTYLAYSRLTETLLRIATSDPKSEQPIPYSNHATAFLDAWSIVDSIYRLRELLNQMPGVKKLAPGMQLFMKTTSPAEDMRHIVQHLRGEIDTMIQKNYPIWGVLSWYTILDLKTFSGRSCAIVAGRHRDRQILPFINPLNKEFRSNIDHVMIRCKDVELPLSEGVRAVERLTKSIEKNLLSQFKDKPVASSDICIMLDMHLNGEVTTQALEEHDTTSEN